MLPYRWLGATAEKRAANRFVARFPPGGNAYLFGEPPLAVARHVKQRGGLLFREKWNCHKAKAKQILDDAYDRLRCPPAHSITEASIIKEREELQLADFVFCPSPFVAASVVENGVDPAKIIRSTYGWGDGQLRPGPLPPARDTLTLLFVGHVSVRKGAHLLLDAWSLARIAGRLVLAGNVEPAVAELRHQALDRPDVASMRFVRRVGGLYAHADIFVLPTLEEGSPLVIYEAMVSGLAIVCSPMAAGDVVRDGIDGIVIPPYDTDAWVHALRQLAESIDLRRGFGQAARRRAQEYRWEDVGRRRRAAVLERLPSP